MSTTSPTDLTDDERARLLGATILTELADAAARHPEAVAFRETGGDDLTYAALMRRVHRIANGILARDASGPVAVVGPNEADTYIGMLGAMHAGRMAVPLDPREGPAQLADKASRLGALVTGKDPDLLARIAATGSLDAVMIEELDGDDAAPTVDIRPNDPALGMFTSGSTGEPKAVESSHAWCVLSSSLIPLSPSDRSGLFLPPTFGAASVPLFTPLLQGGACVCLDLTREPISRVPAWLDEQGITFFLAAPSVLRGIASALDEQGRRLPEVRYVCVGGEVVRRRDLEITRAVMPNAAIEVRYGSSEAGAIAIDVIRPDDPIGQDPLPVGRPVWWFEVDVVGDDGRPLAVGEAGDVVVRGHLLAKGYVDDAERSAAKFFVGDDGVRGYRTGDAGRVLPDGRLVILGRSDLLVKIRGQLVDPAAVERAALAVEGVAEAAALAVSLPEGGARLVLCVVPVRGHTLVGAELRAAVAGTLPPAAVPSLVRILDELPLNANGKVDRSAILADLQGRTSGRAPDSPTELAVATAFASALGIEDVTAADDFFELGGDSMSATEMLATLVEIVGRNVTASALLASPTVEALAFRIDHERAGALGPFMSWHEDATGLPLWFVAGAGANLVQDRLLAERVAGHPFHVFIPRGVDRRAPASPTVGSAARRYTRLVQERSSGRCIVAGFSYGGYVAIDLARRLGDRVVLLVLLDPPPPGRHRPTADDLVKAPVRYVKFMQQFGDLPSQGPTLNRFNRSVAKLHRPRPYRGRAFMVGTRPDLLDAYVDAGVLDAATEFVHVDTSHLGLLREPFVSELAAILQPVVDGAS